MQNYPTTFTQNPHSDVTAAAVPSAARYFDYGAAVALRNLAAAYGTKMPRYLLAPEVAVLLSYETDLKKRLLIDTFWNTGGRLNEVVPLTAGDFMLDGPDGRPAQSPFVVLKTLKQRHVLDKSRRRGRPTLEEQAVMREADLNPPRAVPITDPAYAQRLREYFATARLRKVDRIWDISSADTVRTWIRQAVNAAERDGVTFTVRPITTRTFRDSFAMHLVQHGVPKKVIQTLMGHKDEKSTEWYTQVLALDVTRQLGVRFSMDSNAARALLRGDRN